MEPLKDPENHIRLLWLYPEGEDDNIRLKMSIFDRADTPEYYAISYTWGASDSLQEIFIADESRLVRPNCRDALWQARLHHPASWIWIDSLCVNQENLTEKAHQVKTMGKVFTSARRVLCCIGMETDDVDTIRSIWPEFLLEDIEKDRVGDREWQDGTKSSVFLYEPATALECVELEMRGETSHDYPPVDVWQFHAACDDFVNRHYWQRLWILQEYKLAKERSILCGAQRISENFLKNLCQRTRCWLNFSSIGWDFPLDALLADGHSYRKFGDLARLQCADVRDHIYGTTALFDWREHQQSLEPDYTRSGASLASAVINQSENIYDAWDLCRMLGVDSQHELVQELVRSHQMPHVDSRRSDPADSAALPCLFRGYFYIIHNDRKGRLMISLWGQQDSDHPHDSRRRCCLNDHKRNLRDDRLALSREMREHGFQACRTELQSPNSIPQVLYRGRKSVGLVCHDAQPGDLLMLCDIPSNGMGTFGLALRKGEAPETYGIVGQGILYRAVFEDASNMYDAEIRASGSDLVTLFAQDLVIDRGAEHQPAFDIDRQARLDRLWTKVHGEVVLKWIQRDREFKAMMSEDWEQHSFPKRPTSEPSAIERPTFTMHEQPKTIPQSPLRALKTRLANYRQSPVIPKLKYGDAVQRDPLPIASALDITGESASVSSLQRLVLPAPCARNCKVRHLHNVYHQDHKIKWREPI
ncbi:hypothetical protein CKM354_001231300 [Cercospora kikuchii]|uniref:Heterokaryon incompatibility domain-containing protein n=1 Tax=Cercospora kikuchii TaxID=84275 RepID=A0A9P3FLR1_9PEZI|nr:uncharacterized protein CKM354_001231300 [Cercospora kikuchii]GIZ49281.1 hypothetical protein CKM354_001231300 [Cercospora kikuchii]